MKPWLRWSLRIGGAALLVALVLVLWFTGYRIAGFILGGVVGMALALSLGIGLIRLVLRPGLSVTGVARTLVDEAVRMKVALVFMVALLLLLPVLPFGLDSAERLDYRVQFFLTWSLTAVGVLLSLMTIFLACSTICFEIENRQVFLTLTKPVGRGTYLAGKWLGIVLLNAVLVGVAGGAVWGFARVLGMQPGVGLADEMAVTEQVLTARASVTPRPREAAGLQPLVEQRLAQLRAENPQQFEGGVTPEMLEQVRNQVRLGWLTVEPGNVNVYVFDGLTDRATLGQEVQLRVRPKASKPTPNERLWLGVRINGRPWPQHSGGERPPGIIEAINDAYHVVRIPTELVDAEGRLLIEIANFTPPDRTKPTADEQRPPSVSFTATEGEGIELRYKVGSFEGNLARAFTMLWLRLAFLAMLGLAAGTFLSFPVACLLALLVYVVAAGSGFIGESLASFGGSVAGKPDALAIIAWPFAESVKHLAALDLWAFVKVWIKVVGVLFTSLVPSLGRYNPVPLVADGQVVSWDLLGRAAGNVGLLWTTAMGVLAWAIFRRRELAKVTV